MKSILTLCKQLTELTNAAAQSAIAEQASADKPRWRLEGIKPSRIQGKKFTAVFRDESGAREKTVHFGATGYEDYTTHKDEERKGRYLERHSRGGEDWNDPTTAGALSRWVLWNKPTLKASIADFKKKFGL